MMGIVLTYTQKIKKHEEEGMNYARGPGDKRKGTDQRATQEGEVTELEDCLQGKRAKGREILTLRSLDGLCSRQQTLCVAWGEDRMMHYFQRLAGKIS